MTRPKIALYWCASCGGCEESVVDLAEDILSVVETADIVFWPVGLDFKYSDVEALEDGELEATLINGAIRTSEQEAMARLLREKSRLIVAHGSCAHLGGVVGLANLYSRDSLLRRACVEVPSMVNPGEVLPQETWGAEHFTLELPAFCETVKTLAQTVEVDYFIPGCPPTPALVKNALGAILSGNLPARGSVLAEQKALCDQCPRRDDRPEHIKITEWKRVYEKEWDPEKCFLSEGIICMGPATRGGCEARCVRANFPCRGCFGPTEGVTDQGARALTFLAAVTGSRDPATLEKAARSIPDPAGLFYRYSLAASLLKKKRNPGDG